MAVLTPKLGITANLTILCCGEFSFLVKKLASTLYNLFALEKGIWKLSTEQMFQNILQNSRRKSYIGVFFK